MKSPAFWIGLGLLLGIGLTLALGGLLMMYDSGFLLHPSGYVLCTQTLGGATCGYYQYEYPIRKAEYWIGSYGLIAGILSTVTGFIAHRRTRGQQKQSPMN